jgi:AcrR family transcriptional regulator
MSAQSASPGSAGEGWRLRKRQETRRRIADAGLRLFLERGFEATTLDAIAEAAGIARRTFFHYFESKESLLYAYEDQVEDSFRAALAGADSSMPPFKAMILAMREMISSFGTDRARAIHSVVQSTEALLACKQADYQRLENVLFSALAEKWPTPSGHLQLQMIAMVGAGALRIAVDRWRPDASRSLQEYVNDSFAALRPELLT